MPPIIVLVEEKARTVEEVTKLTESEARKRMHHELKSLHELKMLEEQKRNEIEELKRQSEEEQSIQQTVNQHKSGIKENIESLAPPPSERETSLEETIKDLETQRSNLKYQRFLRRHVWGSQGGGHQ